ncbi:hypothetical protein RQP53_22420 [Paucibacter sp. APW11]|uniref:PEP-CTERM protein-sorting domain-containing protein n=1 Tax=Roseateles aquae TaxID=3077235 RepID=A0ABU3PHJ7_9BURK|nr:hypothetical protein [Paucibacter sp. APW11]MDT9002050.1 hypothetical protein [Paucibacter sp. APW11]
MKLLLAGIPIALALFASQAQAQASTPVYTWRNVSQALGVQAENLQMNARGQLSGSVRYEGHHFAFLSNRDLTGIQRWPQLGASDSIAKAINGAGQIAGTAKLGEYNWQAFATEAGGEHPYLLAGARGEFNAAVGINEAGAVAGNRGYWGGQPNSATKWIDHGQTVIELPSLGGASTLAAGINAAGQVVGEAQDQNGDLHAVLWSVSGREVQDLGTLGGRWSTARALNDQGLVVGGSFTGDAVGFHAFAYDSASQQMRDLGTLGWGQSFARAINNTGMVGGTLANGFISPSDPSLIGHAFITGAHAQGMWDLNSFVHLQDGHYLADVLNINDAGQILALDEQGAGYLLTPLPLPVPEPAAFSLLLAGLFALRGVQRRRGH